MDASPDLIPALLGVTSIHVFGAGLNQNERRTPRFPSCVSVAGASPPFIHVMRCLHRRCAHRIRAGTPLEVAVLFLAPERARHRCGACS
ncbi:MAG: hypothetical protein CM15mP128_2060 [Methanobacteriota archaeon]|nr:MAG: hypothetical protein CM15mP128_2060 [Euryarchaeota archaeon]